MITVYVHIISITIYQLLLFIYLVAQVPPQLQKLVRLVIRAFYQPEHYIVMDILARYPWSVNYIQTQSIIQIETLLHVMYRVLE